MNDYQRMKAGEYFFQPNIYTLKDDEGAQDEVRRIRLLREADQQGMDLAKRAAILEQALGHLGEGSLVCPEFRCDFPSNVFIGDHCFINMDCTILAPGKITIGDNVMIAPHVRIYSLVHPMTARGRRRGGAVGRPVTIGNDVWICGDAIICPGVTIAEGSVIGAGSVVSRDIPAGVFAAGNPCRVIREIGEEDEAYWDSVIKEYEQDPDIQG